MPSLKFRERPIILMYKLRLFKLRCLSFFFFFFTLCEFKKITIKVGGRPTQLLPHAKMLLAYSNKVFFLCWVDYALEGYTFPPSKCDFSCMFHTER